MSGKKPVRAPETGAVWLSPRQVAERLGVGLTTAYALMRKLPRFKQGRVVRVSVESLDAFLTANTQPAGAPDTSWEARLRSADALNRSLEAELRRRPRSTPVLPACSADAPPRIQPTRPRETLDDAPPPKLRPTLPRRRKPLVPTK